MADKPRMSIDHRLLRRAYTLVEAGVPRDSAVEDLVTVAKGSSISLAAAVDRAAERMPSDDAEADHALELVGFDSELSQLAERRNSEIHELLEHALRAVA